MNDLVIKPKDEKSDFAPKYDNWRRLAKIPILILNATTLNTGHNWQFTTSWMGEPPKGTATEIDRNDRLRPLYYWEAPEPYQKIRLGYAVAASACTPALFEPVVLSGLYPNMNVRLVDGGVHDNQGMGSLLEQECNVLLVSDASAQMETHRNPSGGPLSVILRSNNILMSRVRGAQYHEIKVRERSALLRGLMFLHLRKGLDVNTVGWIGYKRPRYDPDENEFDENQSRLTKYGIRKDVQERLATIRSDYDSFNDVEAYALMLSGYRMAEYEISALVRDLPDLSENQMNWRFLALEEAMTRVRDSERAHNHLIMLLEVASNRAFKIWRLSPGLKIVAGLLVSTSLASLLFLLFRDFDETAFVLAFGRSCLLILGIIAILFIQAQITKRIIYLGNAVEIFKRTVFSLLTILVGFVVARIHLDVFDKMYLRRGSLSTFRRLEES